MTTALYRDQPLVSVIVPAYNAAGTLPETLASIIAQRYGRMEIIVVDDGSTDETRSIAERFADTDDRIRIASIQNGGVAVARNTGIGLATGTIIAPIDADDLWHPDYLKTLVALLRDAPDGTVLAYAACRLIDGASLIIGSGPAHVACGIAPYRMRYCNLVGNGSGMIFVKRAALDVGGYDPRLKNAGCQGYEDYLLQLMLASAGRIVGTDAYLVGYRQGAGTMSQNRETMFASRAMAIRIHRDAYPDLRLPFWLDRWIAGEERLIKAHAAYRDRHLMLAGRLLMSAAFTDPVATIVAICGKIRSGWRRWRHFRSTDTHFLDAARHRGETGADADEPDTGLFVRLQRRRLRAVAALDANTPTAKERDVGRDA